MGNPAIPRQPIKIAGMEKKRRSIPEEPCPCCFLSAVSVLGKPLFGLILGQPLDVLLGIGRVLSAVYIKKICAGRGLIQTLFITLRLTENSFRVLLQKLRSLCILFLLANNFFHGS